MIFLMVFIITQIVRGPTIIKSWYACNYDDRRSLLDLYNDFAGGKLDHNAPTDSADSARIHSKAGRSKTDLTFCDTSLRLSDIVSFLGPYIQFSVDQDEPERLLQKQTNAFSILMCQSALNKAHHLPQKHQDPKNSKTTCFIKAELSFGIFVSIWFVLS